MAKSPEPTAPRAAFLLYPWQRAVWAHLVEARRQGRLPHALLISGAPGMGKLQLARNLGQSLLCESPAADGQPCGICRGCHLFLIGHHPDFRLVGPEADSKSGEIKIDFIRDLIEDQGMAAHLAPTKLLVIAPADRMNRHAANSLLKTLEEPAPSTLLALLTHRPTALLPTIRSRCRHLHLAPPAESEALAWLQEQPGLEVDPQVPLRLAGGAPLAALRLARTELLAQRGEALQGFLACAQGKGDLVRTAEAWSKLELPLLFQWLGSWIADLLRLGSGHPAPWLSNPDRRAELQPLAERVSRTQLHRYWQEVTAAADQLHGNLIPQLLLESLLIRWAQLSQGH